MADPPMDRVVALGAKIAELRRQLAGYESELATLLRQGKTAPPVASSAHVSSPSKSRAATKSNLTSSHEGARGTTARIVRLLGAHPRDVFDAAEVAEHLGANVASVRVMLKRLVESGKVRRTGRGAYRAR